MHATPSPRVTPSPRPARRGGSFAVLGLALATVLTGACSSVEKSESAVQDLIRRGSYGAALRQAESAYRDNPGNPELEELYRRASAAYMMEKGRRQTFAEENLEALESFRQAYEIKPSVIAEQWYDKTRLKLAGIHLERGREAVASEDLETALREFERAIGFTETDGRDRINDELVELREVARSAAARTLVRVNYRLDLGSEYYIQGVRAWHEYQLYIAAADFGFVEKYKPSDDKAERRGLQVDALLARRRVSMAAALEEIGNYAAAEKEFKQALELDAELEEAELGAERAAVEAEAARIAGEGEMMILRGEWVRARETLARALELSVYEKDAYSDKIASIEDARMASAYERALDLEHDFDYPGAIKAFAELLEERSWYEDARARHDTLVEYVERSERLYALAKDSRDIIERLALLREIELIWPEYRDIESLLPPLQRRVDAQLAREAAEAEAPPDGS